MPTAKPTKSAVRENLEGVGILVGVGVLFFPAVGLGAAIGAGEIVVKGVRKLVGAEKKPLPPPARTRSRRTRKR